LPVFFQPHEGVAIDTISIETARAPEHSDSDADPEHGGSTAVDSDDDAADDVRTVGDFMRLWSASQGEGNAESEVTKLSPMHIAAAQQAAYIVPPSASL